MLVRDWMTVNPVVVDSSTTVLAAMERLRDGGFRRLPVVDDGRLVGVVTETDLARATPSQAVTLSVYELDLVLARMRVGDVVRRAPIVVEPNDGMERAAQTMSDGGVSGLPVVDGDRVVGIVTVSDVLRAFVTVLGVAEKGVRVTVDVPDVPGVLARVAHLAPPSNIVAAVTDDVHGGRRRIVVRVAGDGADGYPARLVAEGVDVVDVQ